MISLELLRTDPELIRDTVRRRGLDVAVDRLIELDDQLRQAVTRSGTVRAALRRHAMSRERGDPAATKALQDDLAAVTEEVRALQEARDELWGRLPNLLAPDTPESDVELRRAGEPVAADEARRCDVVGTALGILVRGAEVAPSDASPSGRAASAAPPSTTISPFGKGPIWRGDGARLAWAVLTHTQHALRAGGFTPLLPPPDQPLIGCYGDQVVDVAELPLRLCGFSSGLRADAAGRADLPGYRTHQVEQLVLCRAPDAARWLDECQRNIADLLGALAIPYRVVRVGVGALDTAAYQTYATECWFPGSGRYLQTHTNAHCTDYQARRFKIRYLERGRVSQPHTLSVTAVTDHVVLAILENHRQPDGSVRIPEILRPYLGGQELIEPAIRT